MQQSTSLNKISPQSRDIAVTLINVCGLKTRFKNAEFSEYINKFAIIILTETKLDNLDDISVPGFHLMNKKKKAQEESFGWCRCADQ